MKKLILCSLLLSAPAFAYDFGKPPTDDAPANPNPTTPAPASVVDRAVDTTKPGAAGAPSSEQIQKMIDDALKSSNAQMTKALADAQKMLADALKGLPKAP